MNLRNRGSRLMFAPLLTSLLADTDLLFLPLTLSQILFPSNFSHVSLCSGLNDLHPIVFSLVPSGGCSFVPPSFSPFWSGKAAAFLLLRHLRTCRAAVAAFIVRGIASADEMLEVHVCAWI